MYSVPPESALLPTNVLAGEDSRDADADGNAEAEAEVSTSST